MQADNMFHSGLAKPCQNFHIYQQYQQDRFALRWWGWAKIGHLDESNVRIAVLPQGLSAEGFVAADVLRASSALTGLSGCGICQAQSP